MDFNNFMWLQNKFLELFKKLPKKNNQDDQNASDGDNDSTPDIFDEEKNPENINKGEGK